MRVIPQANTTSRTPASAASSPPGESSPHAGDRRHRGTRATWTRPTRPQAGRGLDEERECALRERSSPASRAEGPPPARSRRRPRPREMGLCLKAIHPAFQNKHHRALGAGQVPGHEAWCRVLCRGVRRGLHGRATAPPDPPGKTRCAERQHGDGRGHRGHSTGHVDRSTKAVDHRPERQHGPDDDERVSSSIGRASARYPGAPVRPSVKRSRFTAASPSTALGDPRDRAPTPARRKR